MVTRTANSGGAALVVAVAARTFAAQALAGHPHLLELIELADLGAEHVDDDIARIDGSLPPLPADRRAALAAVSGREPLDAAVVLTVHRDLDGLASAAIARWAGRSPTTIEQPDPGGVSWAMCMCSLRTSWSRWNPTRSR